MNTKTVNYDQYLLENETTNPEDVKDGVVLVKPTTLRKRKFDLEKGLSEEEREELAEQRAAKAQEVATMKRLDLRYWCESKFDHPADTVADEVLIHRLFLKALHQPDVLPGESLRSLALRTLIAYFDLTRLFVADGEKIPIRQYGQGGDVWVPGFNPATQKFTFEGFHIVGGGELDYFETKWFPPKQDPENADQPIDISKLPQLPPPDKKVPVPQAA